MQDDAVRVYVGKQVVTCQEFLRARRKPVGKTRPAVFAGLDAAGTAQHAQPLPGRRALLRGRTHRLFCVGPEHAGSGEQLKMQLGIRLCSPRRVCLQPGMNCVRPTPKVQDFLLVGLGESVQADARLL